MGKNKILLSSPTLATPYVGHLSAYANDLTAIMPDIFTAVDVVSREMVGFIPSVFRNSNVERAAVNQAVHYEIAPEVETEDIVPAMEVPTPNGHTAETGSMMISKAKKTSFGFTGEEQRGLGASGGPGYISVQAGKVAQSLRKLTNEIELDLAIAGAAGASRAYGAAGTIPFSSGVGDMAQINKILNDNGAPASDRSLVVNSSGGANIRSNSNFTEVDKAGTSMTLRDGELMSVHGISVKETGQEVRHTAGTSASATTDATGYDKHDTVITLAAAGTGAIEAGDVVSFAGDANKYMVVVGNADVSAGGTITLALPGLREPLAAAASAITIENDYASNVAFSSNALHLVTRLPALPEKGDKAIDRISVTDVRSGLSFEFSVYPGYRMTSTEIAIAWGVKATKSEHIALLLG